MRPSALERVPDRRQRHTVLHGERSGSGISRGVSASDVSNVRLGEYGAAISDPFVVAVSPLRFPVSGVVGAGSGKQVLDPHARWVIAAVEDVKLRPFTEGQEPGNTVATASNPMAYGERAVSLVVTSTFPCPAIAEFMPDNRAVPVDLRPEPFGNRFSHTRECNQLSEDGNY